MKTWFIVTGVVLIVGATVVLIFADRSIPEAITLPREVSFTELETAVQTAIQNSKMRDKNGNPLILDQEFQIYMLEQTNEYQISYQGAFQTFHISILGSAFEDARGRAENALLGLLNAPREVACALSVEITAPAFRHPDLAGQRFGLSFCK